MKKNERIFGTWFFLMLSLGSAWFIDAMVDVGKAPTIAYVVFLAIFTLSSYMSVRFLMDTD